jgi:hypothetical protein
VYRSTVVVQGYNEYRSSTGLHTYRGTGNCRAIHMYNNNSVVQV